MKITNTFMHEARVLRPGDAIPDGVDEHTVQVWMRNNLVGDNYTGPTRRAQPAPESTKPATPARKQPSAQPKVKPADPKPEEIKTAAASEKDAASADQATVSDAKNPEIVDQSTQTATEQVAATDNPPAA